MQWQRREIQNLKADCGRMHDKRKYKFYRTHLENSKWFMTRSMQETQDQKIPPAEGTKQSLIQLAWNNAIGAPEQGKGNRIGPNGPMNGRMNQESKVQVEYLGNDAAWCCRI